VDMEKRFCDICMEKTNHVIIIDEEIIVTYKKKNFYRCTICGHKSYRRSLRPSAESVY
jgi:hypothetical protein